MADTAEGLAALWRLTTTLLETIDLAQNPEPHPETLHSSWGTVSNTIERIAKSDAYDPSAQEQPNLDVILSLIERLQASPYPNLAMARVTDDGVGKLGRSGLCGVESYGAGWAVR